MIGEIDLQGVLVAPLLIWLIIAYALSQVIRRALGAIGFYHLVWHRALFDTALLVILTGLIHEAANRWISL